MLKLNSILISLLMCCCSENAQRENDSDVNQIVLKLSASKNSEDEKKLCILLRDKLIQIHGRLGVSAIDSSGEKMDVSLPWHESETFSSLQLDVGDQSFNLKFNDPENALIFFRE